MTTAIIVTFDSAAWIERCLESLQTVPTIVIDNASRDKTTEVVRRAFPDVRLVVRPSNAGFAVAANEAMALAPRDDILLMNPDAVAGPDSVATLEAYLHGHPSVGIVVPRLVNPDGTIQENARTFPTPWTMLARRTPFGRMPIGRTGVGRAPSYRTPT